MTVPLTNLDPDGQPLNPGFNWKRNQNKAAASLIGILSGVTADGELDETEILFLQNWLENQGAKSGDMLDIHEDIARVLRDKVITSEEKEDLLNLLNDCIEFGPKVSEADFSINRFLGFLNGIAADSVITENEFGRLRSEMIACFGMLGRWPFDRIKREIDKILRDGVVEKVELQELCEVIHQITGTNFTKYGDAVGGATAMFEDPVQTFLGMNVCLTGKFLSGTRGFVTQQIESLGAISQCSVNKETDILVIGTLSSRDWIHTSIGRKIEKALELRRQGRSLKITNEQVAFSGLN